MGVGMRAGVAAESIVAAVREVVGNRVIRQLTTVDRRAGEPGLVAAAQQLGVSVTVFTPEELAGVAVPNPSMRTAVALGTSSVAEAAALLAARSEWLEVPKIVVGGVTVAAAVIRREDPNS
ncbi:cobalamin biosynthesis protein [Nocardia sp. NPDC051030]|uniref:cobalamin biosynthesis protein n=1 Tax=Nocardia sp. NPDC051030 TaxID=3155162 RepID=UPI003442FF56